MRFDGLEPGEYKLVEVRAPEGYQIAQDVGFELEAVGDVKTVTMEDKLVPIEVYDKTGKSLPVAVFAGIGVIVILGGAGVWLLRRKGIL